MSALRFIAVLAISAAVVCGVCSCANNNYVKDRQRDVGDVFTLTTGLGGGGAARVGPFDTGLYIGSDYAGLRGGEGGVMSESASLLDKEAEELDLIFYTTEKFTPDNNNYFELAKNRGKLFTAEGMPFVAVPTIDDFNQQRNMYKGCAPYWTEVEAIVGVGPSFRIGFNVGEFADLLLGFASIDIYGDDIGAIEVVKAANPGLKQPAAKPQPTPVPAAPAPAPQQVPQK